MTTFSFHAIKTISMGEGGAVTSKRANIVNRIKKLRSHGMTAIPGDFKNSQLAFAPSQDVNSWYYEMHELGLNYRASDLHCALGLSQMNKLKTFKKRREQIVSLYDKLLEELNPLVKPVFRSLSLFPPTAVSTVTAIASKFEFLHLSIRLSVNP